MSAALIAELNKEVEAHEAEAQLHLAAAADKRTTIRVLEERERRLKGLPNSAATEIALGRDAVLETTNTGFGVMSMTDLITNVVKTMPAQQITIQTVYDAMRSMQIDMPDTIRSQISTVLYRLGDKGVLLKIADGRGSSPSIYKLAREEVDA